MSWWVQFKSRCCASLSWTMGKHFAAGCLVIKASKTDVFHLKWQRLCLSSAYWMGRVGQWWRSTICLLFNCVCVRVRACACMCVCVCVRDVSSIMSSFRQTLKAPFISVILYSTCIFHFCNFSEMAWPNAIFTKLCILFDHIQWWKFHLKYFEINVCIPNAHN